ncbi:hypothetical protein [Aeromicrobium sp.]|uniref:hypothetical protein n=1 Tax=Aeromicrobium sp. TaxID=1871063 RepID=UPI003D6B3644
MAMMNDKAPISVRAFIRDLRWMLPLSVGAMLVMFLLDLGGMRDLGLIETLLVGVGFVVVLGPLTWLRWERLGRSDPAFWWFLGGAMVWAVVSLAGIVAMVNALGIQ